MKIKSVITAVSVGSLLCLPVSQAVGLFGLVDSGAGTYSLSSFDSATPGTATSPTIPISGLAANERVLGFDFRPATQDFYIIGESQTVYTLNPTTALATSIGTFASAVEGTNFGFDFNPAFMGGQFARIIGDENDNYVISGDTGAFLGAQKTDVFYVTGDVNVGATPTIVHIAYTNSVPGATGTQQYGIDAGLGVLTTVANNDGDLETVGSLGLGTNIGLEGGFDIAGPTGEAFAGISNGDGTSTLYAIDLTTGNATAVGNTPGNLVGLAAVPEPSSAILLGMASLGFMSRRRRS